jgi:uncharacterized protein YdaU (DUF1376 family)
MKRAWMPLYVADLITDTQDLNACQFGGYVRLMCHYWVHGGLVGNDLSIRTISGLSSQEWRRFREGIKSKFYMCFEDAWFHKRIEVELQKSDNITKSRKASSLLGVAARQPLGQPNGRPNSQPEVNHARASSLSLSKKDKKPNAKAFVKKARTEINVEAKLKEAGREFAVRSGVDSLAVDEEFAQFRDHHAKLGSVMADWDAAWRTWVRNIKKFQRVRPELNRNVYLGRDAQHAVIDEMFRMEAENANKPNGSRQNEAHSGLLETVPARTQSAPRGS